MGFVHHQRLRLLSHGQSVRVAAFHLIAVPGIFSWAARPTVCRTSAIRVLRRWALQGQRNVALGRCTCGPLTRAVTPKACAFARRRCANAAISNLLTQFFFVCRVRRKCLRTWTTHSRSVRHCWNSSGARDIKSTVKERVTAGPGRSLPAFTSRWSTRCKRRAPCAQHSNL